MRLPLLAAVTPTQVVARASLVVQRVTVQQSGARLHTGPEPTLHLELPPPLSDARPELQPQEVPVLPTRE